MKLEKRLFGNEMKYVHEVVESELSSTKKTKMVHRLESAFAQKFKSAVQDEMYERLIVYTKQIQDTFNEYEAYSRSSLATAVPITDSCTCPVEKVSITESSSKSI